MEIVDKQPFGKPDFPKGNIYVGIISPLLDLIEIVHYFLIQNWAICRKELCLVTLTAPQLFHKLSTEICGEVNDSNFYGLGWVSPGNAGIGILFLFVVPQRSCLIAGRML